MAKNAPRKPSDVTVSDPSAATVQPTACSGEASGTNPAQPDVIASVQGPVSVRVTAREPIAEVIDGEVRRFAKGDQFVLEEARAKALGPLVNILIPTSA